MIHTLFLSWLIGCIDQWSWKDTKINESGCNFKEMKMGEECIGWFDSNHISFIHNCNLININIMIEYWSMKYAYSRNIHPIIFCMLNLTNLHHLHHSAPAPPLHRLLCNMRGIQLNTKETKLHSYKFVLESLNTLTSRFKPTWKHIIHIYTHYNIPILVCPNMISSI